MEVVVVVVDDEGMRAIVFVFLCVTVDVFALDMRSEAVRFCRRKESTGPVQDELSSSCNIRPT